MQELLSRSQTTHEHDPEAIRRRLQEGKTHNYLSDAILGGIDGTVTTFAVIAGAVGGGFSSVVVVVLGFAKLVADAFSMAVSNYLSTKSDQDQIDNARRMEERHIDHYPQGEREEVRQIFLQKGFEGEILKDTVDVITGDRQLWVDTMMREELGMQTSAPDPIRAAVVTFLAFIGIGVPSLVPFLFPGLQTPQAFVLSAAITGLVFILIGLVRGYVIGRSIVRSILQTLLMGGGAALLAYFVGSWLRQTFGVG